MSALQNKIDFAVILSVKNANPNGDPLNGNRPRTDYSGFGEITDVCLKRKIRDRLLERGHRIFVQSDDRKVDDSKSLRARAEKVLGKLLQSDEEKLRAAACKEWDDVRAFGQLFPFKSTKKKGKQNEEAAEENNGSVASVSIGIRGPVTIQSAFTVVPIANDVSSVQITKSVNLEDGPKRASDTMGMKHRVDRAVYLTFGSMNPQLAERTGFLDDDAEAIKQVLPKLFENDESSARPAGSMSVLNVIWWKHNSKAGQYSSAKVHRTLTVNPDGSFKLDKLDGLDPEVIDGF